MRGSAVLQRLMLYSQFKWEVGAGGRSQTDWEQLLAFVHQGTTPHRVAALPYKTRSAKVTHTTRRNLRTAGSSKHTASQQLLTLGYLKLQDIL